MIEGRWDKKYKCDFCDNQFNDGHMCWCAECKEPHPMCNECYVECKKDGLVKDKAVSQGELHDKEKYV